MEEIKNNESIRMSEEIREQCIFYLNKIYRIQHSKSYDFMICREQLISSFIRLLILGSISKAAKKMNKRIVIRMRRDALVDFLERSDHTALRVYANQLNLIKY